MYIKQAFPKFPLEFGQKTKLAPWEPLINEFSAPHLSF